MKKLLAIAMVLALALTSVFANAEKEAAPAASTGEVKYAKEITILVAGGGSIVDPTNSWSANDAVIRSNVFEGLMFYDVAKSETSLLLAKVCEFTDASCTKIHVVLRDDIYFSNGQKVTTADVQYSFDRQKYSSMTASYAGCEIVSDTEMYINLKAGNAAFIDMLGNDYCAIICKSAAEADPNNVGTIGTGPYVYDMNSYVAANKIDVIKNQNYWAGADEKQPDVIHYVIMTSSASRAAAIQTGKADFASNFNASDLEVLNGTKGIQLIEFPSTNFAYVFFNDNAYLPRNEKTLALRRAVACALDKEEIMIACGDEKGMVAVSNWAYPWPEYIGDESAFDVDLSYNLDKAKEYLAESGYTKLTVLTDSGKEWCLVASQVIQAQLKKIGLEIDIVETGSFSSEWTTDKYDMAIHSNLFTMLPGSGINYYQVGTNVNRAKVSEQEVQDALNEYLVTTDTAKKIELMQYILKVNHDQVYYIPTYWRVGSYAYADGLEGFSIGQGMTYDFKHIYKVVK